MMKKIVVALFLAALAAPVVGQSASPKESADKPYAIDYYYKVQWGHQDEFLRLFKKNHYPVLKKEMEAGRIMRVEMTAPENHMTEDARWDYRVTIVWKNAFVPHQPFDTAAVQKQIFPDQATFQREEQRRFEILLAHWDLPLASVDLDKP